MVKLVYGQLGTVRNRSAVVEFRVEQHHEKLKARLKPSPSNQICLLRSAA
jgi:hypothetical protein